MPRLTIKTLDDAGKLLGKMIVETANGKRSVNELNAMTGAFNTLVLIEQHKVKLEESKMDLSLKKRVRRETKTIHSESAIKQATLEGMVLTKKRKV